MINEDFPAFGLPTTANPGILFSLVLDSSGRKLTNSSNNSPVPLPLIAAILNDLSKPKQWNSLESICLL